MATGDFGKAVHRQSLVLLQGTGESVLVPKPIYFLDRCAKSGCSGSWHETKNSRIYICTVYHVGT